jgi:hypothetical protein
MMRTRFAGRSTHIYREADAQPCCAGQPHVRRLVRSHRVRVCGLHERAHTACPDGHRRLRCPGRSRRRGAARQRRGKLPFRVDGGVYGQARTLRARYMRCSRGTTARPRHSSSSSSNNKSSGNINSSSSIASIASSSISSAACAHDRERVKVQRSLLVPGDVVRNTEHLRTPRPAAPRAALPCAAVAAPRRRRRGVEIIADRLPLFAARRSRWRRRRRHRRQSHQHVLTRREGRVAQGKDVRHAQRSCTRDAHAVCSAIGAALLRRIQINSNKIKPSPFLLQCHKYFLYLYFVFA